MLMATMAQRANGAAPGGISGVIPLAQGQSREEKTWLSIPADRDMGRPANWAGRSRASPNRTGWRELVAAVNKS